MIDAVLIDRQVEEKMAKCTRRFAPLEAGGLILGTRKDGALHVVDITMPGTWDRHTRSSFYRSKKGHRYRALRLWRQSGGTIDWIGDWHSHPGFDTQPSGKDRRNWQRIVKLRKAPMLFPICDGKKTSFHLLASPLAKPQRLHLSEEDDWSCLYTCACSG
ncbi:Mov34/MPN/PAD-1 family protein [Pelagerythrobacter sp.]|uniref:Mov34/MPN/PAD-1 family protein n=1 Tax=Pelagerythrobacter sp. TaxID=2800702 RepID=UPI0035B45192